MGSRSVTCHPTQVSTPRLNPSHTGRCSIYLPQRDGRLSWPRWLIMRQPGVEPVTLGSWVRHANHYTTSAPQREDLSHEWDVLDLSLREDFLLTYADSVFAVCQCLHFWCRCSVTVECYQDWCPSSWRSYLPSCYLALRILYRHSTNTVLIVALSKHFWSPILTYTVFQKKVSYQTLAVTLSNFYRFWKFFHCQTQREICCKRCVDIPPHLTYVATLPCKTWMNEKPTKCTTKRMHFCRHFGQNAD